jgi:DNA-binding PadR family transcriptional regulator
MSSKKGKLPGLSHVRFLVLDILFQAPAEQCSARALREAMTGAGHPKTGPVFYRMMGEMEKAGLVESVDREFDVDGVAFRRTYYTPLAEGRKAWRTAIDFYATREAVQRKVKEMILGLAT